MKFDVVDLFCGCGGTSAGLRRAGLSIRAGVDCDADSVLTFRRNFPEARVIHSAIEDVKFDELADLRLRDTDSALVVTACAPCQPFSKQNRQKRSADDRQDLLDVVHGFLTYLEPDVLFLENVPGLQRVDQRSGPFGKLCNLLKQRGYAYDSAVLKCQDYGIPQHRLRLVLLASRYGQPGLPKWTHGDAPGLHPYVTVRDAIGHLPPLAAGDTHPDIPNHRAAHLSSTNLRRIRATPQGGGRQSWPADLVLPCHADRPIFTDVYGRLSWDRPASAMTTRCISLSNGRFGHPVQDRAISVREAACLQTFDMSFAFEGNLNSMARQIGNAVPVRLADVFGRHIRKHIEFAARRKAAA